MSSIAYRYHHHYDPSAVSCAVLSAALLAFRLCLAFVTRLSTLGFWLTRFLPLPLPLWQHCNVAGCFFDRTTEAQKAQLVQHLGLSVPSYIVSTAIDPGPNSRDRQKSSSYILTPWPLSLPHPQSTHRPDRHHPSSHHHRPSPRPRAVVPPPYIIPSHTDQS